MAESRLTVAYPNLSWLRALRKLPLTRDPAAMTAEVREDLAISFVWKDSAYFSRVMYISRSTTEERAPHTKKMMPVMKQLRKRLCRKAHSETKSLAAGER